MLNVKRKLLDNLCCPLNFGSALVKGGNCHTSSSSCKHILGDMWAEAKAAVGEKEDGAVVKEEREDGVVAKEEDEELED